MNSSHTPFCTERSINVNRQNSICVCCLQVLHALEGVGIVVFPELRPALFPAGGAVAGGLGFHPLPGQSGTWKHMKANTRMNMDDRSLMCLKMLHTNDVWIMQEALLLSPPVYLICNALWECILSVISTSLPLTAPRDLIDEVFWAGCYYIWVWKQSNCVSFLMV